MFMYSEAPCAYILIEPSSSNLMSVILPDRGFKILLAAVKIESVSKEVRS